MRSSEAANNPKHTSITAQLDKQPRFFFFFLSLFFWVKCATTGLSIDWNQNNQTARADQQSQPRKIKGLENKVSTSQLEMKAC